MSFEGSARIPRALRIALPLALAASTVVGSTSCMPHAHRMISDLRRDLRQAKEACAEVYAPEELARASRLVDELDKPAAGIHPFRGDRRIDEAREAVDRTIELAHARREVARAAAQDALDAAAMEIEAAQNAGAFADAPEAIRQARESYYLAKTLFENEQCRYLEIPPAAAAASSLAAEAARVASDARAKREQEARRQADEERQRLVEEAQRRRKAEQEASRIQRAEGHPAPPIDEWVVAPGECLWLIAADERVYGDPFQWPMLFRENHDQIADPDLIFPDQDLRIPRNLTPAEVQAAIRIARRRVWPTPNYLYDGK